MYLIVSRLNGFHRPGHLFQGPNCISNMLDALNKEADHLVGIVRRQMAMELSVDEENRFQASTHCHICGKGKEEGEKFVHDHDHLTGEFRGAAHNECNLKYNLDADKFKIRCPPAYISC